MAEEKLLVKRDGEFCYPIYFENDFSFLSQALTDEGLAGKSMCIVSDSTVAPLYADQVKAELLKYPIMYTSSLSPPEKHTRILIPYRIFSSALLRMGLTAKVWWLLLEAE